tara:strand:- start:1066 stop:1653 length:588 start_codon:yes stop_codon:yes gene_type:complete
MGMDIYGLNPKQITGIKPEFPDDWNKLSDKAKECYWELDAEFKANNPGHYFRANIWSWRPIHMACFAAKTIHDLQFDADLDEWGFNNGCGLKTQEECNDLVKGLEELIKGFNIADVKYFGYNLSRMWNIKNSNGYTHIDDEKLINSLNMLYPEDSLVTQMPKIKDQTYFPSHVTTTEHLKEFVEFLRHCGGFEIL